MLGKFTERSFNCHQFSTRRLPVCHKCVAAVNKVFDQKREVFKVERELATKINRSIAGQQAVIGCKQSQPSDEQDSDDEQPGYRMIGTPTRQRTTKQTSVSVSENTMSL